MYLILDYYYYYKKRIKHKMNSECGNGNAATEMAIQNRKFAKTCVEKKRRDRINRCLDELKDIMSATDDKARYQKMEKAEILEMAVNYMRGVKFGTESGAPNNGPDFANAYMLAFKQCMGEFQNFLTMYPGIRDDVKTRLVAQMSQRCAELTAAGPVPSTVAKTTKSQRHSPYGSGKHHRQSAANAAAANSPDKLAHHQQYMNKFGGSCSSLDSCLGSSMQQAPVSPSNVDYDSESSAMLMVANESSHHHHHNQLNVSGTSSPSLSTCSSPNSSASNKSTSDSSTGTFVWRPW